MTTVPAVRRGVTAAIRSVTGPRVLVLNGPWLQRPVEPDVIVVGWLPDEGATVEFRRTTAGLGSEEESFDLAGLVSAWRGDGDMVAAVDRADELVESIRTALVADPTVGGVVMRAWLQTLSFSDYQTSEGAQSAVEFAVGVTAYRT